MQLMKTGLQPTLRLQPAKCRSKPELELQLEPELKAIAAKLVSAAVKLL
jgi:hypothetical protein